jgi:hypothetical protein
MLFRYHHPKLTSFQLLIGGVIYLHDISLDVIPDTIHVILLCLRKAFPQQIPWSAVVLVTTKWGRDFGESFGAKEEKLRKGHWAKLLPDTDDGAKVVRFAAGSKDEEKRSALEILHPIMLRHNQWWAGILTRQFRFRQRLLGTGRMKTEEFTRNYRVAVDHAIRIHSRVAAAQVQMEEEKLAEADREQLVKEWKDSLETLKGFDDQVSFWNILSFVIRAVPPLVSKLNASKLKE